jgi:hypothetical protein
MRVILKKYLVPVIISIITIVFLTALRLIREVPFSLYEVLLWISIITNTIVIRTIDDLFDYKDDVSKNKKVIPLQIQCILFVILEVTSIIVNVLISGLFGLIITIAYLLFITASFKQITSLKIFIYPFLLFTSYMLLSNIYLNSFNNIFSYIYIIALIIVVIVISIIYGIIKRGKKYETVHNN